MLRLRVAAIPQEQDDQPSACSVIEYLESRRAGATAVLEVPLLPPGQCGL